MLYVLVAPCPDCHLDIIPAHLEPRTQVLLANFMRSSPAARDEPGYIYALGLPGKPFHCPPPFCMLEHTSGSTSRGVLRIKVGRTKNMPRRISEHRRRCPSSKPILLGCYPTTFCHMLESLVHLELTDIATTSYPANRTAPRARCVDC